MSEMPLKPFCFSNTILSITCINKKSIFKNLFLEVAVGSAGAGGSPPYCIPLCTFGSLLSRLDQ